jgi:hypothetical protein
MNTYRVSGGKAPLILNVGTKYKLVIGFTILSLYFQEKFRQYTLNRKSVFS